MYTTASDLHIPSEDQVTTSGFLESNSGHQPWRQGSVSEETSPLILNYFQIIQGTLLVFFFDIWYKSFTHLLCVSNMQSFIPSLPCVASVGDGASVLHFGGCFFAEAGSNKFPMLKF